MPPCDSERGSLPERVEPLPQPDANGQGSARQCRREPEPSGRIVARVFTHLLLHPLPGMAHGPCAESVLARLVAMRVERRANPTEVDAPPVAGQGLPDA